MAGIHVLRGLGSGPAQSKGEKLSGSSGPRLRLEQLGHSGKDQAWHNEEDDHHHDYDYDGSGRQYDHEHLSELLTELACGVPAVAALDCPTAASGGVTRPDPAS